MQPPHDEDTLASAFAVLEKYRRPEMRSVSNNVVPGRRRLHDAEGIAKALKLLTQTVLIAAIARGQS